MINVGITGIDGLIGWHLRSFLHGQKDIAVYGADKPEFASAELLAKFAGSCDVIVHLAGMNRGDDSEVAATNVALTEQLLNACDAAGARPRLIFSSSTHIYRDTHYGLSKKKCADLLRTWAGKNKTVFTNLVLPNVFGEAGKPFYNSAVSTFCFQLANGQKPEIIKDTEVELLHAQRVAREILSVINKPVDGEIVLSGRTIFVSKLLSELKRLAESYAGQIIPDLRAPDDLDLFNTYRSYLFPKNVPVSISLKKDPRGYLFEAYKSNTGGQTFISSTEPGITRGNHYHTLKFERFLVIEGKACVRVRKLFSKETHEFIVDGTEPKYIDMPALYTHNITNIGNSKLLTLFCAGEIFDPEKPDTYQETV